MNMYSQSELKGKVEIINTLDRYVIVCIAWVFGVNSKNFFEIILNIGKKFETIRVVNDQFATPIFIWDLAVLLVNTAEISKYGY